MRNDLTPNPSPKGEGNHGVTESGERGNGYVCVYLGNLIDAEVGADGFCGFLACGDDGAEMRQLGEKGMDIGGFHHLEELI